MNVRGDDWSGDIDGFSGREPDGFRLVWGEAFCKERVHSGTGIGAFQGGP